MDIIQKFCYRKNPELLDDLPYNIKQFFIEAAKYSIKHKKGRQDIAKIVINQLNIKGDVVIARLGGRGKAWPTAPPDFKNINVTSGSMNKAGPYPIKQLSPMFLGPVNKEVWPMIGNDTALLFENYWQYSKIFPDMKKPHLDSKGNVTKEWREWRKKGFSERKGHRHPTGTKTNEVMYTDSKGRNHYKYRTAIKSLYGNEYMGYIESRKKIYVPLYYKLITSTQAFQNLKEQVKNGKNFQILDFDAPPTTEQITVDMLKWAINQPSPFGKPFGHGYVIAGALLGITPEDYTD